MSPVTRGCGLDMKLLNTIWPRLMIFFIYLFLNLIYLLSQVSVVALAHFARCVAASHRINGRMNN